MLKKIVFGVSHNILNKLLCVNYLDKIHSFS